MPCCIRAISWPAADMPAEVWTGKMVEGFESGIIFQRCSIETTWTLLLFLKIILLFILFVFLSSFHESTWLWHCWSAPLKLKRQTLEASLASRLDLPRAAHLPEWMFNANIIQWSLKSTWCFGTIECLWMSYNHVSQVIFQLFPVVVWEITGLSSPRIRREDLARLRWLASIGARFLGEALRDRREPRLLDRGSERAVQWFCWTVFFGCRWGMDSQNFDDYCKIGPWNDDHDFMNEVLMNI